MVTAALFHSALARSESDDCNGVARILVWGGPLFHDLRRPTRFGGGGGVVAEIFRDRHKPARFSGGGVVAEIFRDHNKGQNFFSGNRRSGSLKSPSFGNIFFTFTPDLEIFRNSFQKKNIYQKFGGGPWPPWPPPWLRHWMIGQYTLDSSVNSNHVIGFQTPFSVVSRGVLFTTQLHK